MRKTYIPVSEHALMMGTSGFVDMAPINVMFVDTSTISAGFSVIPILSSENQTKSRTLQEDLELAATTLALPGSRAVEKNNIHAGLFQMVPG